MKRIACFCFAAALAAQSPGPNPAGPAGNLRQVMRAIPYPNSDIVFAVQDKAPKDEAEWKRVEDASIAVAETANLISLPGRLRENGTPVPTANADWIQFAKELASAGQNCYQAAKTRKQDAVAACTDKLALACSNCHDVYRDRRAPAR